MGHIHFLNLTSDIEESKRQRHVTLPFLKIDMRHWGPPIKGPYHVRVGGNLLDVCSKVRERTNNYKMASQSWNPYNMYLVKENYQRYERSTTGHDSQN